MVYGHECLSENRAWPRWGIALGNPCKLLLRGIAQLRAVVLFVSIAVLLLMAIACTPSSVPSARTSLPATILAPIPQPTPASTPDLERDAIISFTLQALEIEVKRKDLIEYFADLRDRVGTYGQALAIERFFSTGVPATLRDAPPSGFEGMTTLRNRLLLLDSPQSIRAIKDALLDVYDSEIQLASEQLAYSEITHDSLDYWRQLASDSGPGEQYYQYMVGTNWFGLQEIRHHVYALWGDVLKEYGIDPAGLTILYASETDIRLLKERFREARFEAPLVTYFRVLGIENPNSIEGRYHLSFSGKLRDLFRMQQRVGIFTMSGIEPESDWEAYVNLLGGHSREFSEQGERILKAILGMTHEQREQAWLTFEPDKPGDIEELLYILRTGLRSRLGGIGAEYIEGRVPHMLIQWQLENPQTAAGTPMPFLDFLADRFTFDR